MIEHSLITLNSDESIRISPIGVHSGIDITIQNINSSGYIYIGGVGVSISDYGYRILPNHAISIELNGFDSLYAISSDSGMQIAVLKANLETGS